ncbi:MAG: FG-GAP repeat domain-containing protein [Myxococcota bacterium]
MALVGWLLALVSSAVASPPSLREVVFEGVVHDALARRAGSGSTVWIARSNAQGARELLQLNDGGALVRIWPVPRAAIAADVCEGLGAVFADAQGIVDTNGKRLLEAQGLLSFPDDTALYFTPLCGSAADTRAELRFLAHDGIVVKRTERVVTLPFQPKARLFGGPVHEGAVDQRPYALALSLYVPRLYDGDIDGDGRSDLIVVHENRVVLFVRGRDGMLTTAKAIVPDLGIAEGGAAGLEVRVLPVDVDGDGAVELVVARREEAVATTTQLRVIDRLSSPSHHRPHVTRVEDGHMSLLGTAQSEGRMQLVAAAFDTSMMSLGGALLSGRVPLRVTLFEGLPLRLTHVLGLHADVDVRAGRIAGAMPVTTVDFDGDGFEDLLHLGERGTAALYLRRPPAFADEPILLPAVPAFQKAVALPAHHSVLLLSSNGTGGTKLSFVRLPER